MKAAELFVKCLENEGVKYIFAVPGEENLHLLEAMRNSSVQVVVTRHEQSAGFMAATIGRLTGKTGVCLSTLGPGATNFMTAAAYAQLGAMPMLMITGQKPIKVSKQGDFQIIDVVDMMRPLTKFTKQITHASSLAANIRRAFKTAEEERPGAVHLELPEDVAQETVDNGPFEIFPVRRPIAEGKAISQAVAMLKAAKRPLLVLGAGANRKLTAKMLREFVDKTGIPFVNTQMGKGVVDERHPLYIGTTALSSNDYVHCAIEQADCLINIGHDGIEKPPFIMKHNGTKVIHVNFFSAKPYDIYFPHLEVVGDIANAIWQLKEALTPVSTWDFSYFLQIKQLINEHISAQADADSFPVLPQRVVTAVRKAMPEDGIVTLDNGMYKLWFARNYQTYLPNSLLLDNALATMGAGLPSAIATKLVYPQRKVLTVCGDGGFMMNSQELETAVRLKLDLVILLINDNGYGMIKWKQETYGYPIFGLDYGNPDFVKYAQSYGAQGYRLNNAQELEPLLKKTLSSPGIHLIEVPIDYSQNYQVFSQELKQKTCPKP